MNKKHILRLNDKNKINQQKLNPNIQNQKKKKKINLKKVFIRISYIFAGIFCLCFIGGIVFLWIMLQGKPQLNPNDFITQESSIVYDREGNVISELGQTIRKNITYEDLPTSLIDAFVAVEDSRFFEHNGFDVPRFTKAFLENIKTMSFGQGGSTFTMQLIKNTYFVDDEAGQGAAKSIKRKVQEIALAIELENNSVISKKDIFTAYLNKLYFGGTYQNIRGVQKAAEYYFGKEVNELTLPESALLAGVINAPNIYNPYNNLASAQRRRDEVLSLMLYHGYITQKEYDIAVKTKVENLLFDGTIKSSKRVKGESTPYQAYIDEVVDEVYELTGLDPYTTSMKIYTAMDKKIQERMDAIQAEEVDDNYYRKDKNGNNYFYPDDEFETASICVDNVTGEIYGILGGRNYADGGALLLNHATQQKKQPGSSIKPILDYSQAFEILGWSTSHYVTDKPITYPGTSILIGNSNGEYQGDIPLKTAVYESLNTTAISTLQSLLDNEKAGSKYLVDYMHNIGFDIDPNDFNVQYAIGGGNLEATCLQMAGAQSMLMNQGKYNKPHTIVKIEFLNEKAPVIYEANPIQAISAEAAYLTTELLRFNVTGNVTHDDGSHYANLMELFNIDYPIYAKTGTSNWDSSAKVYDIPNGSIKDGWTIASTSKVTVATWIGYEKAEKKEDKVYGYIPYDTYNRNLKGKITKMILDTTAEVFGKPKELTKPDGVSTISHITIPGLPYISPVEGMPEEYITEGLIKTSLYKITNAEETGVDKLEGKVEASLSDGKLTVKIPTYPNKNATASSDHKYDISIYNADGTLQFFKEPIYGKKSFDYSWLYGSVKYIIEVKCNGNVVRDGKYDGNENVIDINDLLANGTIPDGSKLSVTASYGFDNIGSRSNTVDSDEIEIVDEITFTLGNTEHPNHETVFNYLKGLNPNITEQDVDNTDVALSGTVQKLELADGTTQYFPTNSITIRRSQLANAKLYYYKTITKNVAMSAGTYNEDSEEIAIEGIKNNLDTGDSVYWIVKKFLSGGGTNPVISFSGVSAYQETSYENIGYSCTAIDNKETLTLKINQSTEEQKFIIETKLNGETGTTLGTVEITIPASTSTPADSSSGEGSDS